MLRRKKTFHQHKWYIVAIQHFGYTTRMLHRCAGCQKVYVDDVNGEWSMEQLCGYNESDLPEEFLVPKETLIELAAWTQPKN